MAINYNGRAYYYTLQAEARERVQKSLNARILREAGSLQKFDRVTLCSIASPGMPCAFTFAESEWPKYYSHESFNGFRKSWREIAVSTLPASDAFDLAAWQNIGDEQVLVGMAAGRPSRGHTHLTVKWVERFLGHTHLKGRFLWIALACAEEYAKLLGCRRVLIKEPLVPQLYQKYGYSAYRHPSVAHGGEYMAKEL